MSGGASLDSIKSIALATLILRVGSGFAFRFLKDKKTGEEYPKARILFPAAIAFMAHKGWIPIAGLFPVALAQTLNAFIENTPTIKDIVDLKFMDKERALPTAGMSPLMLAARRRQLSNMSGIDDGTYSRNGLYLAGMPSNEPYDRGGSKRRSGLYLAGMSEKDTYVR